MIFGSEDPQVRPAGQPAGRPQWQGRERGHRAPWPPEAAPVGFGHACGALSRASAFVACEGRTRALGYLELCIGEGTLCRTAWRALAPRVPRTDSFVVQSDSWFPAFEEAARPRPTRRRRRRGGFKEGGLFVVRLRGRHRGLPIHGGPPKTQ